MAKKKKYVITFRMNGVTDPHSLIGTHDKPERLVVHGRKELLKVININLSDVDVPSFNVKKL